MNKYNKNRRTVSLNVIRKILQSLLFAVVLPWCSISHAQTGSNTVDSTNFISGTVLDANTKMPVEAARIVSLKHEAAAATTDENGSFRISLLSKSDVLLVKAFGYSSREIYVTGEGNIEIDLYSNDFSDMYPVIEGLTGPVRSSYITSPLKGANEMGNPKFVSADHVIQSKMGGEVRTVSQSGANGIGQSMFIRGLNSVFLNARPMIIVDGAILNDFFDMKSLHDGYISNSLANIDLNDIESVTVMKDGTSLYGSKGSNGIILIKTKRGRDIATKIEINALGGITQKPGSLPMMDKDQFRIYTTDLLGTSNSTDEDIIDLTYLLDDPSDLNYNKYHNNTDWDKEVYKRGTFQSYNISVNGGDKRALYALSMGYTGNWGVVKNTDMQRLNTRFNADFFFSDQIDMGLNIGFTNIDRNLLDDGVNFYTSPTYLAMIKGRFLSPYTYTATGTLTSDFEDSDLFEVGNPSAIIENALNTNKQYRLNMGIKPVFRLFATLSFSDHFEYTLDKFKETYYSPIVGVANRYISGLGVTENLFRSQQIRNNGIYNDARITYKNQFRNKHHINALIGMRYNTDYYESDFAEGYNSGSDQKRNLLNDLEYRNTSGVNNEVKSIANYAHVDYNYGHRYFFTGNISVDGSSRFGRETQGGFQMFNHSWGIFPSASAAWLVSSEDFFSGISFIDRLKLHGSYGLSGNDAIDPYAWSAYFSSTHFMNRANGIVLSNIGNSEIQWETTAKMNFGIDANLLNDRLAISADVYNNLTKDLITLKNVPEIAGTGFYWENGGELSNKGFEVSTTIKALNLSVLKWELAASLGKYTNNIESLPNGDITSSFFGAEILTSVGNPAGVFYGYETNGVFPDEESANTANLKIIDADGTERYFGAGDMHFTDRNNDNTIDEKDRKIIGDPNPDFYGSFNSKVAIGDFTIDAFFTFSYGNDIYNYLRSELESGSQFSNQSTAMLNRWNYEGQVTTVPKAVLDDPLGNSRFSDRWIEDGSYLRLKSLSVNYTVPIKSSIIDGLNVWLSANNLFTLTNYLGRDPEVSVNNAVLFQGIDTGLIPVGRSYFIGIKMNL